MMNAISISFTEKEMQAFIQALDLAVKAGGLNVVNNIAMLQHKVVTAIQEAQKAEG